MMSKPSRLAKPSKQACMETLADRSRMLIVGERLMRAGSEGNLVRTKLNQVQDQNQMKRSNPESVKSEQKPCSAASLDRRQSGRDTCDPSRPWSSRTLPRKHTPAMQTQSSERRREAFLELLKQKYPHHAAVIAGHQERLREHIRTPVHTLVGEQEVLAVMSEGEVPASFTRGSRTRASLPVVKSSNHTKDRSLGVLYLQYGDETRQIHMPNEVSSADTVRALFVSAFPQQLTLKMLESPNMAIYTKDHVRNVYYELTDVRNIKPHSCLKVYHKDPNQAFNHNSRNNNGEARMSLERPYSSRQQTGGQPMVHQVLTPQSPIYAGQGSMSPPQGRSVPSSPSRFTYNPRAMPAGATLPRERTSSSSCAGAILERRDVKPDEDVDLYGFPETRLSMSDVPDGTVFFPHTLYRQKSRKYSESPLSPKNLSTPPPSPHRVNEVRMIDVHPGQNAHVMVERSSSLRRSFRKDSNGNVDAAARARGNIASPVFAEFAPSHGEKAFHGSVSPPALQSERMKAMEQQIATLTGLLQQALTKGANSNAVEPASEKSISSPPALSTNSGEISPVAVCNIPPLQSGPPVSPTARDPAFGVLLNTYRKNVSTLRQQVHQLRQTQLQNQNTMRTMLQQAEEQLKERVCDKLQMLEDPVQKHRAKVNEDRRQYEAMEDSVLVQLGELEQHVEQMERESESVPPKRPVTLRDVEEGAVNLRKVGEALAALKGEFPTLQSKMHSVLRVEVEAVRFLKEEPQKMDAMLKRVKALTDTLSRLRICATEGTTHSDQVSVKPGDACSLKLSPDNSQLRSSNKAAHSELSAPVTMQQVCSSPQNPNHGQDSQTAATVSPKSVELEKSSVLQNSSTGMPSQDSDHTKKKKAAERRQMEEEADMNRMLQQAQANLMMNIPDLEVTDQEKAKALGTVTIQPHEVDGPKTPAPAPACDADPPLLAHQQTEAVVPGEPVEDKPVQTGTGGSCVQKAHIEKPHRAKSNQDAVNKSPPPPPPRKPHPAATGMTTNRSGEVVYTTRKESTPAQPSEPEEEQVQPSPQRVRPEIKPKPQALLAVSAREREEEESEEDKIVAELQVFEKCPVKDLEPRYVLDLTTHVPQGGETFSVTSYDPQNTAQQCEDGKHSPTASPGSGVIYYITGTAKSPSANPPEGQEIQIDSTEGTVSPAKVAHPNACDISQKPNVLTPSDVTLRSAISEEQSESADKHIYASLPKPLKNPAGTGDDSCVAPIEQTAQRIKKKPDNLMLVSASEKLIIPTGDLPSDGPKAQQGASQENGKEGEQKVVLRSSRGRATCNEDGSLSPDTPGEEPPPPPDNIAFMITKTRVQALSTGEYQQLVSTQNQDIETVKVGTGASVSAPEDGEFSKKSVVIVFDEPMDIRQAYKRLSTIFECEEELDRSLSRERIMEDTEESNEEADSRKAAQAMTKEWVADQCKAGDGHHLQVPGQQQNLSEGSSAESEDGSQAELPSDAKQEAKKKFKFKFPKKQLAAIGQALRTGTKTGKKTLQVVVYEDEEEADGTMKEGREAKRFEIKVRPDLISPAAETSETTAVSPQPSVERTSEICQTTYKTLDSLEETIKELETTISNMDPALSPKASHKDLKAKRVSENQPAQEGGSPSKKPAPLGPKPQKVSQRKKAKVQCVPRASSSGSTKQSTNGSSSSSRLASPRSRQQGGSAEKPAKPQKLQDSQSPFRQVVLL